MTPNEFVDELVVSPVGVALLDGLERRHSDTSVRAPWEVDAFSSGTARSNAISELGEMSFGELIAIALDSADHVAGPWNPMAPRNLSNAYRAASARREIAVAVVQRLGEELRRSFDVRRQQWWTTIGATGSPDRRFVDLNRTYCCGEWPWRGMWTITDPPPRSHSGLVSSWEMWGGTLIRFGISAASDATIHEIHRPADWVRLVARWPRTQWRPHSGWELPGPNQHRSEIGDVERISGGRAARTGVQVAMPDWNAVARHVDAVHVSWAGMLTAEGHVVGVPQLGPNVVTMMRYWGSERTLWLRDRFEGVEPMDAPRVRVNLREAQEASTSDERVRRAGLADLEQMLGRSISISPPK